MISDKIKEYVRICKGRYSPYFGVLWSIVFNWRCFQDSWKFSWHLRTRCGVVR